MRHSAERILTTHAGSLARPDALRELLIAKDEGRPFDTAALTARVRSAVAEAVRRQAAVGLDVVNDGEQSKRNFTPMRVSGSAESKSDRSSRAGGRWR